MIRIEVPAVPVAQPRQRHRIAGAGEQQFVQNYTETRHPVTAFKASIRMAARSTYAGPPLDGPVAMTILFVMPRPGRMVWKKRPMPRAHHTAKPDLDNLEKAVKDALTKLLYRDDAQVCRVEKSKVYAAGGETPGVVVTVESIGEGA